jgi:ubiquinone/menaquinone biosynthesis C-methylase UbiE
VLKWNAMQTFDQYGDNYKEVVQRSIDFVGLQYDFFVKAKTRIIKQLAAAKCLDRTTGASLLDVGCGVGGLHGALAGTFVRICGVDVSEKSIEVARERNPRFEYRVMTGNSIPYPAGVFDMATAINVLHHVEPTSWHLVVLELKRVVRPNGLVCVIEHNPFNPLTRLAVLRCPFDRDAHLLTAAQARQLLEGAGLTNVRSDHFLLTPSSSAVAHRVEQWFGRLPVGAQYVATGERPMDDCAECLVSARGS